MNRRGRLPGRFHGIVWTDSDLTLEQNWTLKKRLHFFHQCCLCKLQWILTAEERTLGSPLKESTIAKSCIRCPCLSLLHWRGWAWWQIWIPGVTEWSLCWGKTMVHSMWDEQPCLWTLTLVWCERSKARHKMSSLFFSRKSTFRKEKQNFQWGMGWIFGQEGRQTSGNVVEQHTDWRKKEQQMVCFLIDEKTYGKLAISLI